MKNNKGFTLVELLAVVVVLGIISSIVTLSVIRIKNKAADDACKKIEKQIADLGPQIYSHEILMGKKDEGYFYQKYKDGDAFIVKVGSFSETGSLIETGYLEEIKSPYNSEICEGYLYVDPKATDSDDIYKGFIKCGERYKTSGYDDDLDSAQLTNN